LLDISNTVLDITHIGYLNLSCFSTLRNRKERIYLATYLPEPKSFLHYRQDYLFKQRPVSSIENLEKWKALCQRLNFNPTNQSTKSNQPNGGKQQKGRKQVEEGWLPVG
jgi:hypothetical protein